MEQKGKEAQKKNTNPDAKNCNPRGLPAAARPREAEGQGMGGEPALDRGHLREGTKRGWLRRESSLRGSALGTEPTGTSDRAGGAEELPAGAGVGKPGAERSRSNWGLESDAERSLKRPKTYKILLLALQPLLL